MPAADALHASYSFSSGGLHNSLHLLSGIGALCSEKGSCTAGVAALHASLSYSGLGLYSSMHSLLSVLTRTSQILCMHCALLVVACTAVGPCYQVSRAIGTRHILLTQKRLHAFWYIC